MSTWPMLFLISITVAAIREAGHVVVAFGALRCLERLRGSGEVGDAAGEISQVLRSLRGRSRDVRDDGS